MRFDHFFGNPQAKALLSAAFDSGRVPHAFLIEGPEGAGKRTLAKLIAQAAVCEPSAGETQRPCGKCLPCRKAQTGNHPDIMLYSSGAGPRSFPVDLVRKIRAEAYISPNEAARKIYLLLNVQNMTEQAQNALLKILEEPPAFVLFVLTCDDKSKILKTVLSRCAVLTLGELSREETAAALHGLLPGASSDEIQRAVESAGGNVGRAKALLEANGGTLSAVPEGFADALCAANRYGFLRISGHLEKEHAALKPFLEVLPYYFRDAAAYRFRHESNFAGYANDAEKLSSRLTVKQLYRLTDTALSAREALDRYANATLLLTWVFNRMWLDAHT